MATRASHIGVGVAQVEHDEWYLGIIDREIDKLTKRVEDLRLITNLKVFVFLLGNYVG